MTKERRALLEARRDQIIEAYRTVGADTIKRRVGVPKHDILDALREWGVPIRGSGRGNWTEEERAEIMGRSVELFQAGVKPNAIKVELGLPSRRLVDKAIKEAGLTSRPPGRYPKLAERPCEGCGRMFKPRTSTQRFHDRGCHYASDAQRAVGEKAARERHERARLEIKRQKGEHDLLEGHELIVLFGCRSTAVLRIYRDHGLLSEVFQTNGYRWRLYPRAAALRWHHDWLLGGGRERQQAQDPKYRLAVATARGELDPIIESLRPALDRERFAIEQDAEKYLAEEAGRVWTRQDEDRRRPIRQRRKGRKRSAGPPESWLVWDGLYGEKTGELGRDREQRKELGILEPEDDHPAGKEEIALAVAEDPRGLRHLPEHYHEWDAENECFVLAAALAEQAIDTILHARKRLQKRRTEKAES